MGFHCRQGVISAFDDLYPVLLDLQSVTKIVRNSNKRATNICLTASHRIGLNHPHRIVGVIVC